MSWDYKPNKPYLPFKNLLNLESALLQAQWWFGIFLVGVTSYILLLRDLPSQATTWWGTVGVLTPHVTRVSIKCWIRIRNLSWRYSSEEECLLVCNKTMGSFPIIGKRKPSRLHYWKYQYFKNKHKQRDAKNKQDYLQVIGGSRLYFWNLGRWGRRITMSLRSAWAPG